MKGIKEVIKVMNTPLGPVKYFDLNALEEAGYIKNIFKLPFSIKILLENIVRNFDGSLINEAHLKNFNNYQSKANTSFEIPIFPTRILLQDFTGIPLIVDLAAMRDTVKKMNIDPSIIDTKIPAYLIIDHSLQVDYFGTQDAYVKNLEADYLRNKERYAFLKWAQSAFKNLKVIPPGKGIIHQINIEYLTKVINIERLDNDFFVFPEIILGTDSHTTMVNGLGVLGWGVGGIEAEATLLGLPYSTQLDEVIGVKLIGDLKNTATATDLALTITEKLRHKNVVGKFVEFFGPGLSSLRVPDRVILSNMAPEYGATVGFFPIDKHTLHYLLSSGRPHDLVKTVEIYCKMQGLFLDNYDSDKRYSEVVEIDLSSIEPSISGPTNPEDRLSISRLKEVIKNLIKKYREKKTNSNLLRDEKGVKIRLNDNEVFINDGAVVIAAITSCTNTSNPSLILGAGLLAKKAVEKGLSVKPYVKTSLAPGSRVVTEYLKSAGLLQYLEKLGFHVVGYGCTTCIGNSGPLIKEVSEVIESNDLYTCAVISGNRNFEGRIHPQVRACFLASPILVVAYAIAGRLDIDLLNEPLGYIDGKPITLVDIWPSRDELNMLEKSYVSPDNFVRTYQDIFRGDERWEKLAAPTSKVFSWNDSSTYIRRPPFFDDFKLSVERPTDIRNARVLVMLGDRITTDHISPAGSIPLHSPAGDYLRKIGVDPIDFNTFGSRRGNHEIMMRGTFTNLRLKNYLLPEMEGWWTIHIPSGEKMTIFEAAERYKKEGTSLIILAGKQYGAGSSRDWAAKGVKLLGVRAIIAESFERIHRNNLICMGVLPLQFEPNEGWRRLGLNGKELYQIEGISEGLSPNKKLRVRAIGSEREILFYVTARLDSWTEVEYYNHGGILHYALRQILKTYF